MPTVPASTATPKFFGVNIASFWSDLQTAWRDMLGWKILAWMWPEVAVRLWLPGGGQVLCRNTKDPHTVEHAGTRAAKFEAILLPEDLLLRHMLTLPTLNAADMQTALELESQSLSPFRPDETVWAYRSSSSKGNNCQCHLVLTARELISKHLALHYPNLNTSTAEIWVAAPDGAGYEKLPGFGGASRERHETMWRWISGCMLVCLVMLVAALAVTPSVQLYLRALQANHALMQLSQKVSPIVAQRESLLHASEQIEGFIKNVGKPVSVLQTLDLITRALPDDTSLLNFKVSGLKVTISGLTGNSAALMKQLGNTPGLTDVRAPTAAVKPLGAARETFSIECTLNPEQLGATP